MCRFIVCLSLVGLLACSVASAQGNPDAAKLRQVIAEGPEVQAEALSLALEQIKLHGERLDTLEGTVKKHDQQLLEQASWLERLKTQIDEFKQSKPPATAPTAAPVAPVTLAATTRTVQKLDPDSVAAFTHNGAIGQLTLDHEKRLKVIVDGQAKPLASATHVCEHAVELTHFMLGNTPFRLVYQQCRQRYVIVPSNPS